LTRQKTFAVSPGQSGGLFVTSSNPLSPDIQFNDAETQLAGDLFLFTGFNRSCTCMYFNGKNPFTMTLSCNIYGSGTVVDFVGGCTQMYIAWGAAGPLCACVFVLIELAMGVLHATSRDFQVSLILQLAMPLIRGRNSSGFR
jgi:hypothetical protein